MQQDLPPPPSVLCTLAKMLKIMDYPLVYAVLISIFILQDLVEATEASESSKTTYDQVLSQVIST